VDFIGVQRDNALEAKGNQAVALPPVMPFSTLPIGRRRPSPRISGPGSQGGVTDATAWVDRQFEKAAHPSEPSGVSALASEDGA